jgi:hypothetical protein
MRLLLTAALAVLIGCFQEPAWAGAWTLDRGQVQVISGATFSRASRRFDGTGKPSQQVVFNKLFVQNSFEYGLTNAVTLYVAPEFVTAQSAGEGQATIRARSAAVEAGVRILLLTRIGMFSIQGSGKSAGAFDMSVSATKASGSQAELRVLYGRNYKLLGLDGFTDLQVAERWIRRPRPNEMTIDATIGLWLTPKTLAMFKSYNIVSGGGGQAPYTFYRMHKLELSVVRRITSKWSLQIGAFASPLGQNIVAEQGIGSALWYRF